MGPEAIREFINFVCEEQGWPKTFCHAGYNYVTLECRGTQGRISLEPMSNELTAIRKGLTEFHERLRANAK